MKKILCTAPFVLLITAGCSTAIAPKEDWPSNYYASLAASCKNDQCCYLSARTMADNSYMLADGGKCPEQFHKNALLCSTSYAWCEPSKQPAAASPNSLNEVTFTGVIQAVKNQQSYDGPLSVEVNGKWVIIGGGKMPSNAHNGTVTGLDLNNEENNIGKKVEVFAVMVDPQNENSLTILGDGKYYVRLIK